MRWNAEIESLNQGRVLRVGVVGDGKPVSHVEVVDLWQRDTGFRDFFVGVLASEAFPAYFWETPPITRRIATHPFEFVLVDSPALAGLSPDPHAFARHFRAAGADADVAAFDNLGRDAFLVAPTPRAPVDVYTHIAAFSRNAPMDQRHAFWRAVGRSMAEHLSDQPLWLSTSGLGVAWLHARLDTRPKYYTFDAYRRDPDP